MIEQILITVMTYPTLSKNYFETVCTAGFRMDGSWIRIYPVPHRMLRFEGRQTYRKWQIIEVDLEKNPNDSRAESYHIRNIETLKILHDKIDKNKTNWELRLSWLRKGKKIFDNMSEILKKTYSDKDRISLAVLKPTEILGFVIEEEKNLEHYNLRLEDIRKRYKAEQMQLSLFEDTEAERSSFEFAKKIPYKFSYRFKTKDGKERTLMIEDWEIGMLYLNCVKDATPEIALSKVREKYEGFFKNTDVYLLLGTQYKWHNMKAPDPYVIIGVVPVPKGIGVNLAIPFEF